MHKEVVIAGATESNVAYLIAADLMLFIHALFVAFVVFSLLFIIAGKLLSWSWVLNPWFRIFHLIAIGIVVLQSWLGVICPLTIWEMQFRQKAGDAHYEGAFVAHWIEELLYYQAPPWVFIAAYTLFGSLVVISWFWARPRSFRRDLSHA